VIKTRVTSPNDATNGGNANARGRVVKSTFVLAMSRKSDSGTEVVTRRVAYAHSNVFESIEGREVTSAVRLLLSSP
jgi:hypothetical protein